LFVFKYFYFFTDNVIGLVGFLGWQFPRPAVDIILPLGLSFHTFQSLSYVIEVYQGRQKTERNFITYATYVMFFPQLVAGPIERPQHMLHQFREKHVFEYERVVSGLKRMAWGFFKKLVIADRLALYVNDVYAAPEAHNGLQLTIATVFFAYQIYCDFSGYCDIAIGSARVLGFKLMENFNRPYASRSVAEFWHRWHISLSTWFRDYLYIPLGGRRKGPFRHQMNLLITFGVSGLWHGANWTYVIWGLLNGLYLILGNLAKPLRDRALGLLGMRSESALRRTIMLSTTFGLTCVAWVFFRAKSVGDAWYVLTHFYRNWDFSQIGTEQFLMRQMPVAVASIVLLEIAQWVHARHSLAAVIARLSLAPRWSIYSTFVIGVVLFGIFQKNQFIYFQF
jgi:D-alanyl-lipoteichoic acid acyltransferase DltB (MBOAT superfamily)